MSGFETRRDPTRPIAPAFTKIAPGPDIMEGRNARLAKGGLATPMLLDKMKAVAMNRRGKGNAGTA